MTLLLGGSLFLRLVGTSLGLISAENIHLPGSAGEIVGTELITPGFYAFALNGL